MAESRKSKPKGRPEENDKKNLIFKCPDLKCQSVTIYSDRAEVKRLIKATLKGGNNEVIVKDVPESIDKDSLRVEGKGNATICEVQYQEKNEIIEDDDEVVEEVKSETEKDTLMINDFDAKIKELKEEKEKINIHKTQIEKQCKILESTAAQMVGGQNTPMGAYVLLLKDHHIDSWKTFMSFFGKTREAFDLEIYDLKKREKEIDCKIDGFEKEKTQLQPKEKPKEMKTEFERQVSIILDARKEGDSDIVLAYMVSDASWETSYDFKVFPSEKLLTVHCFALIKQNTGENWNNAEISLTTAQPRTGGEVPTLPMLRVKFEPTPKPEPDSMSKTLAKPKSPGRRQLCLK